MTEPSGPLRRVPVRLTGEADRATTFELFFDLVYVFAATRVTGYMANAHSAHGVLQGLVILALLWWTWAGYAWLGNHARADSGVLRAGMTVAMAALFVVSLTIPEAWNDMAGGLYGPLVLMCAYLIVRCVHLTVYAVAAVGDPGLRRQVAISALPLLAGAPLLLTGVLLGGRRQTLLAACALLVDWGGTYLTSREGHWRLRSAAHWTERHGLFVILTLGESVAAIGVGAARHPISTPLLAGAVLGIAIAVCLWWLYFDVVSLAAERRLREARGKERVAMAIDAYTYGHFPIVTGIMLTALGVEGVLSHAEESTALGTFYASALFGGPTLYLAGHVLFKRRMLAIVSGRRLVAMAVLLAALPLATALPPLAGLAGVALILTALITAETTHYAPVRRRLRGAAPEAG
ncbi:low temperature requirement protein A [Streptomyces litchfieldiae]|uniref:Low temperature requirement protein A n=1 Tax=Streptomyces litchfieldiae TaxID=3075543 RepID=A0ABU2MVS4_9ACTN|nr:low temperature requirement protein A [Streptomyces sp. DSM 44938]MDT0345737.1 low temperature requirement protein A [Streptomyces sp. DSM 44938]